MLARCRKVDRRVSLNKSFRPRVSLLRVHLNLYLRLVNPLVDAAVILE